MAEFILFREGVDYVVEQYEGPEYTRAQLFARWAVTGNDYNEFLQIVAEQDRRAALTRAQDKTKSDSKATVAA